MQRNKKPLYELFLTVGTYSFFLLLMLWVLESPSDKYYSNSDKTLDSVNGVVQDVVKYRGKGSGGYYIYVLYHQGWKPVKLKTNSDAQCYQALEKTNINNIKIEAKYISTQHVDRGFDGLLVELESNGHIVCDLEKNLKYWDGLQESDKYFFNFLLLASPVSFLLAIFFWIVSPSNKSESLN